MYVFCVVKVLVIEQMLCAFLLFYNPAYIIKTAIHVAIWSHMISSHHMEQKVVRFYTTHRMRHKTVQFCNAHITIYRSYATKSHRVYWALHVLDM